MGMSIENMLRMFPPGYVPGDIYKEIADQACTGDGWHQNWMFIQEDAITERFFMSMAEGDPMWYRGCSYKEFFGEGERDQLFDAINSGDEQFVRKAFQLRPGQDGLYINLNVGDGHPGLRSKHPEDPRFLSKPAIPSTWRKKIGDAGCELLARCLPQSGVRSLVIMLSRNGITAQGAKALAKGIPECVEDLKLFVNSNEIRNQGCIALAQKIQRLKGLKSLHIGLGSNLITDQGNTMLAECLPENLEYFHCMMRWNSCAIESTAARERMWQAADTLPNIDSKDEGRWWLLY